MKSSSSELQVAASEPTHERSEHLARQEEDEYFLAQSRNLAGHIDWRNQYSVRTEGSRLGLLVETLARRLEMARQVAFAKWDTRSQVEDAAREAKDGCR
jgi:chorismate mutase